MAVTFYALQKLRASDLQAIVDDRLKVAKSGDTPRSTTTSLVADPHLVLPLQANYTYSILWTLYYNAPAAGDIKFAIDYPAGATTPPYGGLRMVDSSAGLTGNVDPGAYATAADATDSITMGGTGGNAFGILASTIIMGPTAGNLSLLWAQLASSGTTTLLKGSAAVADRHR